MRLFLSHLMLLVLFSCGDEKALHAQNLPQMELSDIELDELLASTDSRPISDLLPTMYYTVKEADVRCKGGYGASAYNGKETQKLLTVDGKVIATVCKRFAQTLLMEGSGILKYRGRGEIGVNYGGKINSQPRYHVLDRCKLGEGIRKDLCLLPYHTIASDNDVHKIGDIIFIPAARGIKLPDGSVHEGYFIVRDTGGAFNGIGAQRVDLFVGTDPDFDNAFQKAGFHHKRPLPAYKISGESAELIKEKLKNKFGELY